MSDSSIIKCLSKAVGQATRSANFCVVGCLPVIDPHIEIEGVGAIPLPLRQKSVKELVGSCQVAPYGKGTQTLVNKKVRNTLELDPKNFRLSEVWHVAIAEAMRPVADQLGLQADQLEARLYKLLVYEKGGFFLPHRDSEKHDGMVASMIVVLPNPFEGGELVVRHGAAEQTVTFDEAAAGNAPCYAAFYADCEHEVERVTSGVRLCLAYNLVLKPKRTRPAAADPADTLTESIRSWVAAQPAKPLVFALEYHYTQRGLSLDLLKGADRKLADLVLAAATKTNCIVHLAQVSRHLIQIADDGSSKRGYRNYGAPRRAIEIGETRVDELIGRDWADVGGRRQPWGDIAFDLAAIVSSVPIDDWMPTSEEFEGYTGNEGGTLDRWYHCSALVIWQRDHEFDVIARCGAANGIPVLGTMVAKLTRTSKKRLEESRSECIRFARAIIAVWPDPKSVRGNFGCDPRNDFPQHLLKLRDRDTIAMFLRKLADQDQWLSLDSLVVGACRKFGWSAFTHELKNLFSRRPGRGGWQ